MADSLTISIGADSSKLRAELAVAQSEMRAFSREMNSAANVARKAGDDLSFAKVGQAASQFDQAAASVSKLKGELAEAGRAGQGMLSQLTGNLGGLGALKETVAGLAGAFAVHEIVSFAREMADLGEKTRNTTLVLGLTVKQVGELSGMAVLAGGDFDLMQRTLERLAVSVQHALVNGNSQSAVSFRNLGISMAEVRAHANDLPGLFELLVRKVSELQPGMQRTAELHELVGRGMDRLAPLISQGSAGYEELKQKAQDYKNALAANEAGMLRTADASNTLALDLKTLAIEGFSVLEPAITSAAKSLDWFVNLLRSAVQAGRDFAAWADSVRDRARSFLGMPPLVPGATPYGPQAATTLDDLVITGKGKVGTERAGGGKSKGAAPITSAFDLADSAAQAQIRIDASYLSAFKANMQAMVDAKTITVTQMLGFDIQYTAQLAAQDQARLAGAMSAADAIVATTEAEAAKKAAAQLKVWEQEMQLSARTAAAIAQDQQKIAADAKKTADAWAAPFKTALDQLGSEFEKTFSQLLLRQTTFAKAWQSLYQAATSSILSMIESVASKTAASALGAAGGQGLGEFLSGQLFGAGAGGLFGSQGALFGTAADASIAAGGAPLAAAASGGGFLSTISSFLPFLAFAKGGIVPSAAGGWALPSFPGAQPALLHGGEMVLPRDLSQGFQSMIRGGGGVPGDGGSAGDIHLHSHFHGPADAAGIARFFKSNQNHIADALQSALRSNRLTPRTL